jgi:hypothetical protein
VSWQALFFSLREAAHKRAVARRAAKFWEWFAPYAPSYHTLENLPPKEAAEQVQTLLTALARVHPVLGAEIEKLESGIYEMVITARGDREAFDAVRAVVEKAPALSGWKIIAFRQPRSLDALEFPLESQTLTVDHVWYTLTPQAEYRLLDAVVFVVTDEELSEELAAKIGYLCLDAAVGEVNVATKLGQVQFFYWPAKAWDGTIELNRRGIGEVTVACKPMREFKDDFEQTFKEVLK